jgi:hypothetical protein
MSHTGIVIPMGWADDAANDNGDGAGDGAGFGVKNGSGYGDGLESGYADGNGFDIGEGFGFGVVSGRDRYGHGIGCGLYSSDISIVLDAEILL